MTIIPAGKQFLVDLTQKYLPTFFLKITIGFQLFCPVRNFTISKIRLLFENLEEVDYGLWRKKYKCMFVFKRGVSKISFFVLKHKYFSFCFLNSRLECLRLLNSSAVDFTVLHPEELMLANTVGSSIRVTHELQKFKNGELRRSVYTPLLWNI